MWSRVATDKSERHVRARLNIRHPCGAATGWPGGRCPLALLWDAHRADFQRQCRVNRGISPEDLTDPDVSHSTYLARAIARRLPSSTERTAPPVEPVGPNHRLPSDAARSGDATSRPGGAPEMSWFTSIFGAMAS